MSERDQYPAGVPCWVETLQPDPRAAIDFYGSLFGWEFSGPGQTPGDPAGEYFVARVRGRDVAGIGSMPSAGGPATPMWSTQIRVASADAAASAVERAGGRVLVEPFDAPPAGRLAVVADPAGAVLCTWEAGDREGAQLVNEPRAWAMSTLNTADPEGSKEFYGAVFGWDTDVFDAGGAKITLFRLPGYQGGEPRQPVPRDVVAVMLPVAPGTAQSHWSVDFWIDDADLAVATATRLGGQLVASPRDTPGFRSAVLADLGGAIFSVSQLTRGR
jgi:predicted enzyme related to lactoylglutathione lyase